MTAQSQISGPGNARTPESGFTLLELMVGVALFLVIAGPIMSIMATSQRNYRSSEVRVSLEQKMRGAIEMMTQEVSQAGLQPAGVDSDGLAAPLTTVASCSTNCITATPTSPTPTPTPTPIAVGSTAGIYRGEWLWVDGGANAEANIVAGVTGGSSPTITFQNNFALNHAPQTINGTAVNTPIYGLSEYPGGIVLPGTTPSGGSTSTQLELFGDLNGNGGALQAVIYSCPATFPGPFTRTLYDATTGAQISTIELIDNVTSCQFTYPNPLPTIPNTYSGQTCFAQQTPVAIGSFSGDAVITSIGITITAQSTMNDPVTHAPVSLTKSFLNIQPRNIISALNVVCISTANELQNNPASLP